MYSFCTPQFLLIYNWCVGADDADDDGYTGKVLEFAGFVVDVERKTLGNLYTVVFPKDCSYEKNIVFKTQRNPKTKKEYQLLVDSGAVALLF